MISENLNETIHYRKISYIRDIQDTAISSRGNIWIADRIINSYPSIKRAFNLKNSLKREFRNDDFIIEEKIDGTNIRITNVDDEIIAFTRGGYHCPYTTEFLNNKQNIVNFFQDYPGIVMCGELIGPNPYNYASSIYGDEPEVLVFDLFKPNIYNIPNLVRPIERQELLEQYSINTVPVYGKRSCNDYNEICEILRYLNITGKEGLVFKPLDTLQPRLKYTVYRADVLAIADFVTKSFEEYSPAVRNRFYHAACYLKEINGLDLAIVALELGKSILERLMNSINDEEVAEEFKLTMSEEAWNEILHRMRRHIRIRIEKITHLVNGKIHVHFKKIYPASTDQLKSFLTGHCYVD